MAPVSVTDTAGNPWFACGTTKTFRSASCIDREPLAVELRAAKEHIKRLESGIELLRHEHDPFEQEKIYRQTMEEKP